MIGWLSDVEWDSNLYEHKSTFGYVFYAQCMILSYLEVVKSNRYNIIHYGVKVYCLSNRCSKGCLVQEVHS